MRSPKAENNHMQFHKDGAVQAHSSQLPQSRNKRNQRIAQSSPHQQLIAQLKHQIMQLLPLRSTFPSLVYFYQQTKSRYEDLLHHMNQTHYLKSSALLNSEEVSRLASKLRGCEVQYEEMSDYLNLHLLDKLSSAKIDNKTYCQALVSMEQQLQEAKQELKTHSLSNQVLKNQHSKLFNELPLIETTCTEQKQNLHKLNLRAQFQKQQEIQLINTLNQLKSHQSLQHEAQSHLLQSLLDKKKLNHELTLKLNQLNENTKTSSLIQSLLTASNLSAKDKLLTIETSNTLKRQELLNACGQTVMLQGEIAHMEKLTILRKQQLAQIDQQQIPSIISESQTLTQDQSKARQFLNYLRNYESELKSTSNLMFEQLNQCCKEDYQKILNSSPTSHLNPFDPTSHLNPFDPSLLNPLMAASNLLNFEPTINPRLSSHSPDKNMTNQRRRINQAQKMNANQKENFELQKQLYLHRRQSTTHKQ